MSDHDELYIQPEPTPQEHRERFIKGSGKKVYEFEEVLANPEAEQRRFKNKDEIRNFRWLYIISIILMVSLLSRGAFLQIGQSDKYRGLAEGNRLRSVTLAAPRGILYDRHGEQLVENVPSYQLVMRPVDVPTDKEQQEKLFKKIAKEYEISLDQLNEIYSAQDVLSFNPVPVLRDIPRDQALLLQAKSADYPGFSAEATAIREYESPFAMAHISGYVGKLTAEEYAENPDYELTDSIGKSGIELSYEGILKGKNGAQYVEVDALGQVINVLGTEPPVSGSNLRLTIDKGLQEKLYESLSKAVERSDEKRGSAVAIDPRNGEILAMVSIPSFDLNDFSKGIEGDKYAQLIEDPDQPLFNRPVAGSYSPGSTFKPFVAVGALAEGVIDENTRFFDTGVIEVGGQEFKGWKPGGHGDVNVIDAIANSVNGFFYSIGGGYGDISGIGIKGIVNIAKAFGFANDLELDLPGSAEGLLPTPEWKEENWNEPWYLGDTYNASIGQGFVLVTPLQLANATAAIANGGNVWWPHFGKLVEGQGSDDGPIEPKLINELAAEGKKAIQIVRRGMRATVDGGTGRLLADLPVAAAGKTGTAQFGTGEPHAWFTAFAPYEEPTIALAVLVEEAGEGSDFSVPVAHEVLNYYFTRDNQNE